MAVATQKPVPMPMSRRFRAWRQRFLPFTVWLGAIALIVVLAQYQQMGTTVLPGVVELNEVSVSPLNDGRIGGITVDLLDDVVGNQIVALMDDSLIRGELITAQAELSQLKASLADEKRLMAERRGEQDADLRRFVLDVEQARLEHLDRWAQQESDRVALRRLEALASTQRDMVRDGVFDELTYDQTRLEAEAMRRRVEESEAVLAEAKRQIEEAGKRLAEYRERIDAVDSETAIGPMAEAIAVQETMIQGITQRMNTLVLRAPIGGKVARILYRPGETVAMGAPLLTISGSDTRRIMAYVEENTTADVVVGDSVEVFTQRAPARTVAAKVLRVGSQVEPLPEHLQQSTTVVRWGRPILLGGFPEGAFIPGQAVMVRYAPESRFPFLSGLL